jgi:PAS domain S-box-containing protein
MANPAAIAIFDRGSGIIGDTFGVPLVAADKTVIDVVLRDGSAAVLELRVVETSWGGAAARLVMLRDVTERSRHEAEVRELNAELHLRAQAANVLTHVGDGVFLLDDHGVVRVWNPAAARILGVPVDAAIGRHVRDAVRDWDRIVEEVELTDAPFDESPQGRTVLLDAEGPELWLSITGVRFAAGTVYAFHDLSDEVRVDALKKEFIDTAAHELRTPLTAIYGAAHTLRRADIDLGEHVRRELVEVICTQAQRLQSITEGILDARRLEDGAAVEIAPFDVVALADAVVGELRESAAPAVRVRVRVEHELEGEERVAASDQDKLRQVLVNLVQNAVKYSPDGGDVVVEVRRAPEWFEYAVRDQGVGIAPANHASVFDKFFRAPSREHERIPGTGLGLYIARELARRLGGDVLLESVPGTGSTFSVRVPVAAAAP